MKEEQMELVRATEANLLGCLFLEGAAGNQEAIKEVRKVVTPDDFLPSYRMSLHRRIYEAMLEAPQSDYLSVATAMHEKGTLQFKDISYMVTITADVIGLDYEHYAWQVSRNAFEWRSGRRKKKLGINLA